MATNAAAQNAIKKRLVSKLEVCEGEQTCEAGVQWERRMVSDHHQKGTKISDGIHAN